MSRGTGLHVLVLTDAYPPEARSSAILMGALVHYLAELGHRVTVLTSAFPHNVPPNLADSTPEQEGPRVQILRLLSLPFHNLPLYARIVGEATLVWSMVKTGVVRWALTPPDVILGYTPPMAVGIVAAALKLSLRAPLVLLVQDLYPETVEHLGMANNPVARALLRKACNFYLAQADVAVVHSEGNARALRSHPVFRTRPGAVVSVPNFVPESVFAIRRPATPAATLLGDETLRGKKLFLFGGVMGYAQDVRTVVQAARLLEHDRHLYFLLVGRGNARRDAEKAATGLGNIRFADLLPPDRYRSLAASAFAAIVPLKPQLRTPVVPWKLLEFMALARPVVLSVSPQSDAIRIVSEARCGIVVPPGDPAAMARACAALANDETSARAMGQRGLAYAMRHFASSKGLPSYRDIIDRVARRTRA